MRHLRPFIFCFLLIWISWDFDLVIDVLIVASFVDDHVSKVTNFPRLLSDTFHSCFPSILATINPCKTNFLLVMEKLGFLYPVNWFLCNAKVSLYEWVKSICTRMIINYLRYLEQFFFSVISFYVLKMDLSVLLSLRNTHIQSVLCHDLYLRNFM